jgi:hypothetical protein
MRDDSDDSGTSRGVCLLLQYLLQSCLRGGRGIVQDMCYERRRAEAFPGAALTPAGVWPGGNGTPGPVVVFIPALPIITYTKLFARARAGGASRIEFFFCRHRSYKDFISKRTGSRARRKEEGRVVHDEPRRAPPNLSGICSIH